MGANSCMVGGGGGEWPVEIPLAASCLGSGEGCVSAVLTVSVPGDRESGQAVYEPSSVNSHLSSPEYNTHTVSGPGP